MKMVKKAKMAKTNQIIEKETLLKVAKIARLNLSKEEIEEFLPQLNDVLEAFSTLKEFEAKETEPCIHPIEIFPILREDKNEKCFSQEDALSLTKHKKDGYFKGPKIV